MPMIPNINNADLFLHNHQGEFSILEKWLLSVEYPWNAIQELNSFVQRYINDVQKNYQEHPTQYVPWSLKIHSHEDCVIEPNIFVEGFVTVGHRTRIESYAYFNGNIIIGNNCVIESGVRITGNVRIGDNVHIYHGATITGSSQQSEMPQSVWLGNNIKVYQNSVVKASIIMNDSRIFSNCYLGASVVGKNVLIGSGAKLVDSKFRNKDQNISIKFRMQSISTELKRFGVAIGNNSEIASNVPAYPGTIVLPDSFVLANEIIQDVYDRKIK